MLEETEKRQTQVIVDPPNAHCPKQELMLQFFLQKGVEEIWAACGTKFGKTTGAAGGFSIGALQGRSRLYKWIAPRYSQASIGYDNCRRILPPPPITKRNETFLKIKIPSLDTSLEFFHSNEPEALEGFGVHGYCFDEAAKQDGEAYKAAITTQTKTGRKMALFSTPLGKNWFYKGCMEAKDEMLWAYKKGVTPRKIFIHARTRDNPTIDPAVIEKARRDLPDRLFKQYYLAEFIDDADVFGSFRKCFWTPEIFTYDADSRWISSFGKDAEVVIGVDWAKSVDYTVFFAADIATRKIVGFERFHKTEYVQAIRKLMIFSNEFRETAIVLHDKTGVGSAIDEQLAFTGLPYHGHVFTNASKAQMVTRLITATEQNQIGLPAWNILEREMQSYEVQVSTSGNFIYGAPAGEHDDTVSALLLTNQALIDYGASMNEVQFLEDLPKINGKDRVVDGSIEAYYQNLIEELEDDE